MRTWLTRLVVNACNTHRRRNFLRGLLPMQGKTNGNGSGENPTFDLEDPSSWGAPEDQAMLSELRRTVNEVLARLRLEHRTVLMLHYYLELSCPEIARILECPEGTVYSRLHYARQLVQEELEKHEHAPGNRRQKA
jgi:RNA polymerase sigma-70 factor (ECF subfamily)